MKHALIFAGSLVQVADEVFDVHPDFLWVNCADNVSVETYHYVDGALVAKPREIADTPDWRPSLYAELRTKRDAMLNISDGIQSDFLALGDTATALTLKAVKQAFKDIPGRDDLQTVETEADFRAIVLAGFKNVIASLPAAVQLAFKEYLE
jgi:hypothetical protein